jgi:hypothetical protein
MLEGERTAIREPSAASGFLFEPRGAVPDTTLADATDWLSNG